MTHESLFVRAAARWKIPRDVALLVLARDQHCIYCKQEFTFPSGPGATFPTWEHIVNDLTRVDVANIALCCHGCNSSKGKKSLDTWLDSTYCTTRGITRSTIAEIAIPALEQNMWK
jgi:hypothetical protein